MHPRRSLFVLALVVALVSSAPLMAASVCAHTTYADVVALDQAFYNNRMGAFQAGGQVFALRRDVVSNETGAPGPGALKPGLVMVRPDKRPRPIVLRVNVGDCLEVSFQNLLAPQPMIYEPLYSPPKQTPPPNNSVATPYVANDNLMVKAYSPQDNPPQNFYGSGVSQPATRWAGVHVMGMELVEARDDKGPIDGISADGSFTGANGVFPSANAQRLSGLVAPGAKITYTLHAPAEGSYLLYSTAATSGSSGGFGGQLSQGLFGSVTVQPPSAEWYRSQVTHDELLAATRRTTANVLHATGASVMLYGSTFPVYQSSSFSSDMRFIVMDANDKPATDNGYLHFPSGQPFLDYQAKRADGTPILRMTMTGANGHEEIVYSDLTAIITGPKAGRFPHNGTPPGSKYIYPDNDEPFREFAIHYHDDFVTTQAFPQFNTGSIATTLQAGRDFFAINYGMGGIGAEILANRFGVGPMWNCATCKFEEFFLSSWTDGDPAQVVDFPANSQVCASIPTTDPSGAVNSPNGSCTMQVGPKATKAFYPDDPSNVYHSYLKDHVKIQILHAGTNITHVHHLHAQQWLHTSKNDSSQYRDSQMISPGGSYTLDHVHNGSGNLNLTVGDSIFHCHFYPHFAQGMWSLWRTHDVFEPGTKLDREGRPTGEWNRALPDGEIAGGTPTPAIVPMPQIAMAPMPARVRIVPVKIDPPKVPSSISVTKQPFTVGYMTEVNPQDAAMNPGFPFFVPGIAGQRAPHPPLDFAPDDTKPGTYLDGGLPRAVTLFDSNPYEQHTRWDFTKLNNNLTAVELPQTGTPGEVVAMNTHSVRNHPSFTPEGAAKNFLLNGQPSAHGAPYANPAVDENGESVCKDTVPGKELAPESGDQPCLIRYKAADVQIDAVVNKVGWHYPQTRMISLWDDVRPTVAGTKPPEPFFFRANSHQVIEYWLTNLVPAYYELDDFQVRTPTDIIGQHIHLVKFDVTSSDGAANGYNYEDGTLGAEEVHDLIGAINKTGGLFTSITNSGGFMKVGGPQKILTAKTIPFFGCGPNNSTPSTAPCNAKLSQEWVGAQATIQRWYADPQLTNEKKDQTLRTVF
ncbi:MAG: manganese oxidase, partial [Thermoanaerobaculia bacterium]|nr:manganese oxidase [Thermoanaerobaculia bacterium]